MLIFACFAQKLAPSRKTGTNWLTQFAHFWNSPYKSILALLTSASFFPLDFPSCTFPRTASSHQSRSAQSALLLVSAAHPHRPPISNSSSISRPAVKSGIQSGKKMQNSLETWCAPSNHVSIVDFVKGHFFFSIIWLFLCCICSFGRSESLKSQQCLNCNIRS